MTEGIDLSDKPTLLLMSESKTATKPGYCSPKHRVSKLIDKEFKESKINMQIDKETGAMVLDSSVLFDFNESFLTEEGPLLGGMLEDVLKQNGIPVLTESNKGAALSVISGPLFEWISYYVRYDHLAQAKEIVGEVLHASAEAGDAAEEDTGETGEEETEEPEA